jgi:hypothetical protein
MVILVASKLALYIHHVVIWRGRVIDYKSKHTYPLTAETLTLICALNTSYQTITAGFGIFSSKQVCNNPNNKDIEDWGYRSYILMATLGNTSNKDTITEVLAPFTLW